MKTGLKLLSLYLDGSGGWRLKPLQSICKQLLVNYLEQKKKTYHGLKMYHVSSPTHPYPAALAAVMVVVAMVCGHYHCCGCGSPVVMLLLALFVVIVDDSQPHPYLEGVPALYV